MIDKKEGRVSRILRVSETEGGGRMRGRPPACDGRGRSVLGGLVGTAGNGTTTDRLVGGRVRRQSLSHHGRYSSVRAERASEAGVASVRGDRGVRVAESRQGNDEDTTRRSDVQQAP